MKSEVDSADVFVGVSPVDVYSPGIQSPPILPSQAIISIGFLAILDKCSRHCFILGPALSSAPAALASSALPSLPLNPKRPPSPASGLTTIAKRIDYARY